MADDVCSKTSELLQKQNKRRHLVQFSQVHDAGAHHQSSRAIVVGSVGNYFPSSLNEVVDVGELVVRD